MPPHVLVLGSGAREHALVAAFLRSPRVDLVYGNGQAEADARYRYAPVDPCACGDVVAFVEAHAIALVVIGPEAPLVAGVVDALEAMPAAVRPLCFGPRQAASRLEADKVYAKAQMRVVGLATPKAQAFTEAAQARNYVRTQFHPQTPVPQSQVDDDVVASAPRVVLKYAGLAGGKGVVLPETLDEAYDFLDRVFVDACFGPNPVMLVEDRLYGVEVSVLGVCNGRRCSLMPLAKDYKRLDDGDCGPNTGGIGAYAPALGVLTEAEVYDLEAKMSALVKAHDYVGVLYAGVLRPHDRSLPPQVLEFNVRLGDPEAQVLLPLLRADWYNICVKCANRWPMSGMEQWWDTRTHAVNVVVCHAGYPATGPVGADGCVVRVAGDNVEDGAGEGAGAGTVAQTAVSSSTVACYVANATRVPDAPHTYRSTKGGRLLSVVATDTRSLFHAHQAAYAFVRDRVCVDEGHHYRRDIAWTAAGRGAVPRATLSGSPSSSINVALLGSTRGTSTQALLESSLCKRVKVVVSDRHDALILEKARAKGIPAVSLPRCTGEPREAYDARLLRVLTAFQVDVVWLVGYMRIVSPVLIRAFPHRMFNVHPSLLPRHPNAMDLDVHRAVLAAGDARTGCTIHEVTEAVDGGPIVLQRQCVVGADATPETLKSKVQQLEAAAILWWTRALVERGVEAAWTGREQQAEAVAAKPRAKLTYKDCGVDIDKGNAVVAGIAALVERTTGADPTNIGRFCALIPFQGLTLAAATDGVGTKLELARRLGRYDTVGIDLVAMCANDLVVHGARPLFFLDYLGVASVDVDVCVELVKGVQQACASVGCELVGGETAELGRLYRQGTFDMVGFCGGVVEGEPLPKTAQMAAGDAVWALPSSGVHSNGYSLLLTLLEREGVLPAEGDGESVAEVVTGYAGAATPVDLAADALDALGHEALLEACLTPTKLYVQDVLAMRACDIVAPHLLGVAHVTGGGVGENVRRVLPAGHHVRLHACATQFSPLYQWIQRASSLSTGEMLATFNCGMGMVLVVRQGAPAAVGARLQAEWGAVEVGRVVAGAALGWEGEVEGEVGRAGVTHV